MEWNCKYLDSSLWTDNIKKGSGPLSVTSLTHSNCCGPLWVWRCSLMWWTYHMWLYQFKTGCWEGLGMRPPVDPTLHHTPSLYHPPPGVWKTHSPSQMHLPSLHTHTHILPTHTSSPHTHLLPTHTHSSQISYFGLQYQTKSECLRWVDRQKPLRKQLEKYAVDGARNAELRFRVQYYVTTVTKLQHEITKWGQSISKI